MEVIVSMFYGAFLFVVSFFKKDDPDDYLEGVEIKKDGFTWVPMFIIRKREGIFQTGWGKSTYGAAAGDHVLVQTTHQVWASKAGIGSDMVTTDTVVVPNSRLVQGENKMFHIEANS